MCIPDYDTRTGGEVPISNIWTGAWYERTIAQEKMRLGTPNIRLLVVTMFIDNTALDQLGRNKACPIIVSLLNYTQEVIAMDKFKKLLGFYPDVRLTNQQKNDAAIVEFLRDLNYYVTEKFVDQLNQMYEEGGIPWVDTSGQRWQFVPVMAFLTTDMDEAKYQKGLYKGHSANMPCMMCENTYRDGGVFILPKDLKYRDGYRMATKIEEWREAIR